MKYGFILKNYISLITQHCAIDRCSICLKSGTWYQKYEMCYCESCYDKEIKRSCIELGCNFVSKDLLRIGVICKEYYCDKHLSIDNKCRFHK